MPSGSVIAAVLDLYDQLAFTPKPPVYFGEVPVRDAAGDPVGLPYVVVEDDGTEPEFDFEYHATETTRVRFEVYAATLAAADAVAEGIKYGGGAVTAQAGFDFTLSLPYEGGSELEVVREGEQRFREADRGGNGTLVYRVRLRYRVSVQRD